MNKLLYSLGATQLKCWEMRQKLSKWQRFYRSSDLHDIGVYSTYFSMIKKDKMFLHKNMKRHFDLKSPFFRFHQWWANVSKIGSGEAFGPRGPLKSWIFCQNPKMSKLWFYYINLKTNQNFFSAKWNQPKLKIWNIGTKSNFLRKFCWGSLKIG